MRNDTFPANRCDAPTRCHPVRGLLANALVLSVALLGACGGDDDGSSTAAAPAPAPAASPTPPPGSTTTLTITGTAATGAAIAGATVDLRCAVGTASGTTAADGTYSIAVAGGALPCVLRATPATGPALYSVATGTGSVARANLTPVTHLVVAQLGATDPASYYAGFTASVAAALVQSAIASAEAAVIATLSAAGIDLSATPDPISAALIAASGDAYDHALDLLAAAFVRSGTTLDALATTVGSAAAAAASPAVGTATTSLPAELLLQPAATSCASLRTASYRVVTPVPESTLAAQSGVWRLDATTLGVVRADGSTGTWVANGACRFTDTGGAYSADVVVSAAGVLVGRYSSDNGSTYRNFIGFPEQAHALAELAGAWNEIGMTRTGSGFVAAAGSVTLDASGTFTGGSTCQNNATWAIDVCGTATAGQLALLAPLQADPAGGFDAGDAATHTTTARVFAYRSGGGVMMVVQVGDNGNFATWTPQATLALPAVGLTFRSWDLDMFASLQSSYATYETQSTVDSVDAGAGSYLRTQGTIGQAYTYQTTILFNNPRSGFVHRAAVVEAASDGRTVQLNEFTFLILQGMGVSPVVLPGPKQFEFSVTAP